MSREKTLYNASPAMFRNNPIGFVVTVALCFVGIGIPILLLWWLRNKDTVLTVTDERTTLRRGILAKSINEVWHRDVRNVQISQSFLQRIFGVGTIGVSSAGQAGMEIEVAGLPAPYKVKALIDQQRRYADAPLGARVPEREEREVIDQTPQSSHGHATARSDLRMRFAIVAAAVMVVAVVVPKFVLWCGVVLMVLCIGASMRKAADLLSLFERYDATTKTAKTFSAIESFSRRALRLTQREQDGKRASALLYWLGGTVLIVAGWTSSSIWAHQETLAARRAAQEAEQKRVVDEANREVAKLVAEAESAWKGGNSAIAMQRLDAASRVHNTTDLNAIDEMRRRIGNAQVEALVADAKDALERGDIDRAKETVVAALAVSHADDFADAKTINEHIVNATEPSRMRDGLMMLSDASFQAFRDSGTLPPTMLSGYGELDRRAQELGKTHLTEIAQAREARRLAEAEAERRRLEAQRLAAESEARKAEAERNAEIARSEARRKAEEAKRTVGNEFDAQIFAEEVVKQSLKYPEDAQFNPGFLNVPETRYIRLVEAWYVEGTVKAANAFGARLTQKYQAIVYLTGSTWKADIVVIGDEVVFHSADGASPSNRYEKVLADAQREAEAEAKAVAERMAQEEFVTQATAAWKELEPKLSGELTSEFRKELREFASRFKGTKEGQRARSELTAAAKLDSARQLLKFDKEPQAMRLLREVLDSQPNSMVASEVEDLLRQLE